MLTVDERARADLIARLGALRTFLDGVYQNGMGRHYRTIDDVTTAISQLDEARAVALEEAASAVDKLFEWYGTYPYPTPTPECAKGSLDKARKAIRALNSKPAAPSAIDEPIA